jgi:hypothetical protein
MARAVYGADGSAQVVSLSGVPTLASATVKSARTGGVTITDITKLDGTALGGVVTPDNRGQIVFMGPDGSTSTYWLDFGDGGPRWAVKPVDLAEAISTLISQRDAAQFTTPGGTSTKAALPYVPNSALQKLVEALDTRVTPRFASAGARDIAFPAPADGDRVYRSDLHAHQTYRDLGATSRWVTDTALIQEQTISSDATSVNFLNIPQEWRTLVVKYRTRVLGTASGNSVHAYFSLRFNNDTGANYAHHGAVRTIKGVATTVTYDVRRDGSQGGASTATANLGEQQGGLTNFPGFSAPGTTVGFCPGSAVTGVFGSGEITIEDYTNSTSRKGIRGVASWGDNGGGVGTSYMGRAEAGGGWHSNAAITRIELLPTSGTSFASGSTFRLYGWS